MAESALGEVKFVISIIVHLALNNSKTDSPVTLPLEHFTLCDLFRLLNVLNGLVEKEETQTCFSVV